MAYSMDFLSMRLDGPVGARNYVRNSYSQWAISITLALEVPLSFIYELDHLVFGMHEEHLPIFSMRVVLV